MSIPDIWQSSADDDFDKLEESNLELHVRQCIRRDRRTGRTLRLILVMVGLELVVHFAGNVPGLWSIIAKLMWAS